MSLLIFDFEDGTSQSLSNVTVDSGTGANSTSKSAYCSNPTNGSIEPIKAMSTGYCVGYDNLEMWVKWPAAWVLASGDASAIVIEDSGGWKWTSMFQWSDPGSTSWQKITIPLTKFTADGNSTPSTGGTGAALIPSAATNLHIRIWNSTARNWYFDEAYLTTNVAAGQPTGKRIQTIPFLGGSLRQRNF